MSKQCLDVQQMQHLQELVLDTSNASMCWIKDMEGNQHLSVHDEYCYEASFMNPVPAYTLQDVLDALPSDIKHDESYYSLHLTKDDVYYVHTNLDGITKFIAHNISGELIDMAYKMLVWCIENKFVETNKNE